MKDEPAFVHVDGVRYDAPKRILPIIVDPKHQRCPDWYPDGAYPPWWEEPQVVVPLRIEDLERASGGPGR